MAANNIDMSTSLNEQQVMMLRLLKNPMPEKDFLEMRRLAVKLLSKKLDRVIGDFEEKNAINSDHYDKLSQSHFRSKS